MEGLSKKEIEVISELEFYEKYYFTREDIIHHFKNKSSMNHTIHKLLKKKRIISLNKNKYYLVPIKAKSGSWVDHSFIVVDEVMNGEDYYIGGWSSAHYWRLTEQVPMKIEVYSKKRSGKKRYLNTSIIFRKTRENKFKEVVTKKMNGHTFKILNKEASKKWFSKTDN
ncbi:MAG: hypothetical protein PHU51_04505 [Candidatus Nanoarchaeia archaeon]|nr:hypothetical protein [Candidatus Nanoarchaeia archaeon]